MIGEKEYKTVRLCIDFFFLGWRVTEVHTDGMKFTDERERRKKNTLIHELPPPGSPAVLPMTQSARRSFLPEQRAVP